MFVTMASTASVHSRGNANTSLRYFLKDEEVQILNYVVGEFEDVTEMS